MANVFQVLKESNSQLQIPYQKKLSLLSIKNEGEIKIFSNEEKLKEFVTNVSTSQVRSLKGSSPNRKE